MNPEPSECPGHVWSSVGVSVIEGTVHRIWDCERCRAWTNEPLDEDGRVPWAETDLSK